MVETQQFLHINTNDNINESIYVCQVFQFFIGGFNEVVFQLAIKGRLLKLT